jgi:hypothetical protein
VIGGTVQSNIPKKKAVGKIMVTGFWDKKAAIHKNFHLGRQQ